MMSLELHFRILCWGKANGFAHEMTGGMWSALNKRNEATRQTFITSLHTLRYPREDATGTGPPSAPKANGTDN